MTPEIKGKVASNYAELKSGVNKIAKIDEGWMSNNFTVESGGNKYFLKCYRSHERQPVVDAQAAKFFFSSHGVPVILPIRTRDKETILRVGGNYFSLFPFVSGCHFNQGKTPPLAAKSLGQMLGRIHRIGERGYPRISDKFKPWNKDEFHKKADAILRIIDAKVEKTKFDIETRKIILFKKSCVDKEKLGYSDFKNLRIGLIHGDYHNGNVFFNRKGAVTHVFDFEKTSIAPFVFEVVRAIQYSHVTGYGKQGHEKSIADFLQGYEKERPLKQGELSDGMEIFYQKQIHSLWVEQEHYLRGNTRVDNLLHKISYLKHVRTLSYPS